MTHAGLLLTKSPGTSDGKFDTDSLKEHIKEIEEQKIPDGYSSFFERWSEGLSSMPSVRLAVATATSRTLIGHGLASTHQVGLSLHHTYGVPYLPGSALKGMLSHYVHATLGAGDKKFRGPVLDQSGRVSDEPGEHFRALFGSAPSDGDKVGFEGYVEFHDALLVPDSAAPNSAAKGIFAPDVLTPHQDKYYLDASADPNDYTSPVPVSFVTAKPKLKYQLFVSGPADWTAIALELLGQALEECGVGGKTTSGYGRFRLEGGFSDEELTLVKARAGERRKAFEARQAEALRVAKEVADARRAAERKAREEEAAAELAAKEAQAAAEREAAAQQQRIANTPEDVRRLVAGGEEKFESLKARLSESKAHVENDGLITLADLVEAVAAWPRAARPQLLAWANTDWADLATMLGDTWAGGRAANESLIELRAKIWATARPGVVDVFREGQTSKDREPMKAHIVRFGKSKLYDKSRTGPTPYALSIPGAEPAEFNAMICINPSGKIIEVKPL